MKRSHLFAFILFTIPVLLFVNSAWAGSDPPVIKVLDGNNNQLNADSTIEVEDAKYFDPGYNSELIKPYGVQNFVKLKINESSLRVLQSAFTATVQLRIIRTFHNGIIDSVDQNLTVNYDGDTTYTAFSTYRFRDAYRVKVKVLGKSTNVGWDVWKVLMVENELQSFPQFDFSCSDDAVQSISSESLDSDTEDDELVVSWSEIIAADEYDLEWTFVDKSALDSNLYGNPIDINAVFENNASRVTIAGVSYPIPLLYDGNGTLFFRVRSVQLQTSGGRTEAHWSSDFTNGYGSFVYEGHERPLNWQATTSFAEEGKRKSVVQYYDGSLRSRQTVTKDNSTYNTIVAESFYDYQGRPVIQVLPAPTLSNIISYAHNFNINLAGDAYDKQNFDSLPNPLAYCSISAEEMKIDSGASRYYSTSNPEKNIGFNQYIPDAQGYPFTEVQYTQDNTGRIKKQSGVGPTHKLGSGHETVYYYGTPDQKELDALFGTEVGYAEHYFKTMVRDANGQYSISYVDMHGRTIATALADTTSQVKLDKLSSYQSATVTEDLSTPGTNVIRDLVMESKKSLLVSSSGLHTFTYQLDPESLMIKDCDSIQVCYDCLYDLTITITDDCNNQKIGGKAWDTTLRNFTIGSIDTTCGNPAAGFSFSFDKYLVDGNYEITKSLSLSRNGASYYRDSVFIERNACKDLQTFIDEQRDILLANADCQPTCQECLDSLGTWEDFRDNFMERSGIAPEDSSGFRNLALTAYTEAGDACDVLCNSLSEYDLIRQNMLMDLVPPSGQYANFDSTNLLSIFYASIATGQPDTLAPYTLVTNYLNSDGGQDLVYDEMAGAFVYPQQLSPHLFADKFQLSWAEALLPFHPEYCKLQFYEQHLLTSFAWDERFRATETYAEAKQKGYLDPTNMYGGTNAKFAGTTGYLDHDLIGSPYKANLESKILDYTGSSSSQSMSLWAFATALVKCSDQNSSCLTNYISIDSAFNAPTTCESDLDMAWRNFRTLYLQYKRELIQNQLNIACSSPSVQDLVDGGYEPHFGGAEELIQAYGFAPPSNSSTASQETQADIDDYYEDNCTAYAHQWWQQLKPCNYNSTDSAIIIQELILVCKEGSDMQHIFGASSVKPSSNNVYRSFEQVIKTYNLANGKPYNQYCNAYLITAPLPYDKQPAMSKVPLWMKPDSCLCETLDLLYSGYQLYGSGDADFSAYLYRTTGSQIANSTLDTLRGMCDGTITCNYLPQPIMLPPALQCGIKDVCLSCKEIGNLVDSFEVEFPDIIPVLYTDDTAQLRKNDLFVNYLNQHTGFSKSLDEYINFMDTCSIQVDSSGTSQPPFTYITVSSTGVAKPSNIACSTLINLYSNFLSDYPEPQQCAEIKMFIVDTGYTYLSGFSQGYNFEQGSELPDTAQTGSFNMISSSMASSPMTGYWIDTTLCCEPLLAWYFNSHLGTTGYTYSHFMDWLVNSCGYDLHQLPCNDTVVAPCDSLQIILDSFRVQYPDSLGALIYEFKEVPVHKITHVSESYSGGSYSGENSWFSGASLTATTWTVGGQWQKIRDNLVFDFRVLPRNATIDSAYLNLYAKPDQIEFFPCCGAHYRNNTQNIFGIFERSLGPVIPGQILWNNLPGTTGTNAINLPAISISNGNGSGNDLYSNEDFLNRGMTSLVQDMYSRVIDSNINYGLMFRLNDESLTYKAYTFWGIENYTPTGENPHLMVRYSASRCDVFTAWVNNALGTHLTPEQVGTLYSKCGISIDCPQPKDSLLLCGKSEPVFPPVEINDIDNCSDTAFFASSVGQEQYNSYRDSLLGKFDSLYTAKCMDAYKFETFTVTRDKSEFHYTLYYYDQAGNLVKTVPPEGVHPRHDPQWLADVANARENGQVEPANHTLATEYRYNTLNQVVAQSSPDGGLSEFWYDRLGRLVVSQNAKQKAASGTENGRQYSYTIYDYLGRISEVGQITNATTDAMTDAISRDPADLTTWIQNSTANREQITRTVYDLAYTGFTGAVLGQRNLRNRVSYTTYSQGNNPAQYNNGSFYTYDAHGNVDTLLQDYGSSLITFTKNVMNANGNRFKKMVYRYDLISGKVNHVAYQPGQADQFYHRYSYDAENRLILVETSQDSAHWERDARYTYFKHGPLARMVVGEQQVQGLDYAYTLQGWIKGVNATSLNSGYDMGQDGQAAASNQYVARDAYSYSLNYFTGDYTSISGLTPFPGSSAYLGTSHRPLYNGNISSMAVNIRQFNAPMLYNYRYDQLNRLTAMDAFNGLNASTNSWAGLTAIDAYKERVSYDGNGNILTYTRNANSSTIMDDLTYRYSYDGNGHLDKNQLLYVDDAVGSGVNADDIDDQSSGNYIYDQIGNLVIDDAEGIDAIEWNVYGKIASITKSGDPNNITSINYTYDAGGNRISKTVTKSTGAINTTWYVRDASGNVMALYTAEGTDPETPESFALKLTEQHLYGSSRLGILTRDVDMEAAYTPPAVVDFVRGHKFFELSNHLGNVLVTISDKKTGHDAGGGFYDYYDADVVTANDYYPFGMLMPGRKYSAESSYRYGFNGKENDNEVKRIEGSQQDYGMRVYDPRLGKFLSVDPLRKEYPWYSTYHFAGNKPIWAIDLDGAEEQIVCNKLKDNDGFKTILYLLKDSKILDSYIKQFSAQNNYILVYTTYEAKRQNLAGIEYYDPYWYGNTSEVKSKEDWQKDYVAYNINYSEIEGYIKAGKKVIVVGIASHRLKYGGETSADNNSLQAVQAERDALWTLIHELVAHAFVISQGKVTTGQQDHEDFQGEKSSHSPSFYELLSEKKYKNTKAGKLAKKLMDYYEKVLIPIITKTSLEHEKAAKEFETKKSDDKAINSEIKKEN